MHGVCFGVGEDFAGDFGNEEVEAWFMAKKGQLPIVFFFFFSCWLFLPLTSY